MWVLFISTYDELITIGLLKDDKLIMKKEKNSNREHSIYTVPLIDEILKENNLKPKDLKQIIVINGPGSFTGVRLGITVAKTLAYTLKIPIKQITSIEALGVSSNIQNKIITISDAKGKYFGIFKNGQLTNNLMYLSDEDFDLYIKKEELHNYVVISNVSLNIELINNYAKDIKETPAHAIKAIYIKDLHLNGI